MPPQKALRPLACAALACLTAAAGRAQPIAAPPAPGVLVDIGARRLHLYCTGKGPQTVLIENGAGAFSFDWALVQPEVSKFARVCTYDRAGYAWSDPGPALDMVAQTMDDLHLLVRAARIRRPFVLVGASAGGFFARAYQRRYPEDVSGMVMVDSTTEETSAWIVDGKPKPSYSLTRDEMDALMRELLDGPVSSNLPQPAAEEEPFNRLPKDVQALRDWAAAKYAAPRSRLQTPAASESTREEFIAQRAQRLSTPHPLGRLPLIVLTQGRRPDDARKAHGEEIAHLSAIGRWISAEHSGHEIHLYRPDVVIQAIREVLAIRPA